MFPHNNNLKKDLIESQYSKFSNNLSDGNSLAINLPKESKVGKKLSDLTTKRVIVLVLAILFSVPLFSTSTYIPDEPSYEFGLKLLTQYEVGTAGFNAVFDIFIMEQIKISTPIVLVNANSVSWTSQVDAGSLRATEQQVVSLENGNFVAIYDLRKNSKLQAGLGIGTTLFVCFILASGALLFSKEANDLVIQPLEVMIQKVNRISANPLLAA
jgi:hypothetical protein